MSKRRLMAVGSLLAASGLSLGLACSAGEGTPSGTGADTGDDTDRGLGGEATTGTGGAGSGLGVVGSGPDDGPITGCAEGEASAELVPANLLFVVDKSGSMNCNPPPTDLLCLSPEKVDSEAPSKWEITQEALTGDSGALPTLAGQEGISVGLLAFPTDDFCAVPAAGELTVPMSALTTDHLGALTVGLSLTADGQTPVAGATIRGLAALRGLIDSGDITGKHYLVVMTDGAETCQVGALDDVLWYVEQANYYYGIKTYAIGAPGSEAARALLSEIAVLGGTRRSDTCKEDPANAAESCHVDLTESSDFAADLGDEFKGITEQTASACEYDVPTGALVDPSKVNVEFTAPGSDPELVPLDAREAGERQCEGANGWQFAPGGKKVVLCGDLCDAVRSQPESKIRVIFGCRDTVLR